MTKNKCRILFTSFARLPFIQADLELLNRHCDVKTVFGPWSRILGRLLINLHQVNLSICWFGSASAAFITFLSRLMHKPTIIIIAGIDVARVPELKYGAFLNPIRAQLGRFLLKKASRLLLVDRSLNDDIVKHVGSTLNNVEYLPTGYDPNLFRPAGKKEKIVLTVAWCPDMTRLKLKGIDIFIRVAAEVPSASFWIVGMTGSAKDHLIKMGLPANVTIFEPVRRNQLIPFYQKTSVYCQLSYREGLPNALCEAMLCGCIPVGANRGGIKTAIGDAGFCVEYGDVAETVRAVNKALKAPARLGIAARNRIRRHFSIEKREAGLLATIHALSGR